MFGTFASFDTELLTGPQAVKNSVSEILANKVSISKTVVHLKISSTGITLTDNSRKYANLFTSPAIQSSSFIDPSSINCLLIGFKLFFLGALKSSSILAAPLSGLDYL